MKIACPRCGANVTFMPNSQKCYCEYCGSLVRTEEIENNIKQIHDIKNKDFYDEYTCSTCGAKLITTDGMILTDCVYCGSRQLIKTNNIVLDKEAKIIPFKFNRSQFIQACCNKISGLKGIPSNYKNVETNIYTCGIYIPCKIKIYRVMTDLVAVLEKERNSFVEEMYQYNSEKQILMVLDYSREISETILGKIEDYDFEKIQNFNSAYLSGFVVEKFDESKKNLFLNEEEKIIYKIKKDLAELISKKSDNKINDLRGRINIEEMHNDFLAEEIVFLPIWFARVGKDIFRIIMNGQTGTIHCTHEYREIKRKKNSAKTSLYIKVFLCLAPGWLILTFMVLISCAVSGSNDAMLTSILGSLFVGIVSMSPLILMIRIRGLPKKEIYNPTGKEENRDCIKVYNKKINIFRLIGLYKEGYFEAKEAVGLQVYRNNKFVRLRKSNLK